jgi:single-strand DNA-binding protein
MSVSKTILIGRLGKDPEIRTTQDGKEIANFGLATSETWKDKNTGERKEKTEWHRVVVFNPSLVSVIKSYVKKGSKIYVEGCNQTRKWQDKEGKEHSTTEVVLNPFKSSLTLLDSKDKSENQDTYKPEYNQDVQEKPIPISIGFDSEPLNDEIPF